VRTVKSGETTNITLSESWGGELGRSAKNSATLDQPSGVNRDPSVSIFQNRCTISRGAFAWSSDWADTTPLARTIQMSFIRKIHEGAGTYNFNTDSKGSSSRKGCPFGPCCDLTP
jgi:hypothetical protein